MVRNLANSELAANLDIDSQQHYLCLAAAYAVLQWVELENNMVIATGSLKVTFNGSFHHMYIDANSRLVTLMDQFHQC
eukprot:jgi/Chlat1/9057/Chrsp94S08359